MHETVTEEKAVMDLEVLERLFVFYWSSYRNGVILRSERFCPPFLFPAVVWYAGVAPDGAERSWAQ